MAKKGRGRLPLSADLDREAQRLRERGLVYREIAHRLGLSISSVGKYLGQPRRRHAPDASDTIAQSGEFLEAAMACPRCSRSIRVSPCRHCGLDVVAVMVRESGVDGELRYELQAEHERRRQSLRRESV